MSDNDNESQTDSDLKQQEELNIQMNIDDNNEIEGNFVDHERVGLISKFFNEKQMNRYAKFKESSLEK